MHVLRHVQPIFALSRVACLDVDHSITIFLDDNVVLEAANDSRLSPVSGIRNKVLVHHVVMDQKPRAESTGGGGERVRV